MSKIVSAMATMSAEAKSWTKEQWRQVFSIAVLGKRRGRSAGVLCAIGLHEWKLLVKPSAYMRRQKSFALDPRHFAHGIVCLRCGRREYK